MERFIAKLNWIEIGAMHSPWYKNSLLPAISHLLCKFIPQMCCCFYSSKTNETYEKLKQANDEVELPCATVLSGSKTSKKADLFESSKVALVFRLLLAYLIGSKDAPNGNFPNSATPNVSPCMKSKSGGSWVQVLLLVQSIKI
ncbi:hypothetical protein C0J52_26621 [Blattella germanica]|nr:hypothetical protein C0J52_26621 [Blattella germanica]